MSLRELTDYLDTKGYTIETLPEFIDLSIGACLETPIHGSSNMYSSVADLVTSVTIYDKGKVQTFHKGTDDFNNVIFNTNDVVCFIEATIKIIPQRYLKKSMEFVKDDIIYSLDIYDYFRNNLSAVIQWYPDIKRVLRWKINETAIMKEDHPRTIYRFGGYLTILQYLFSKKVVTGKNHNILGYWKNINFIVRNFLLDSVGGHNDLEFAVSPENYLEVIKILKSEKVYGVGFRYAPAEKCFPNSWCYEKEALLIEVIFTKKEADYMQQLVHKFALKEHNGKYVV